MDKTVEQEFKEAEAALDHSPFRYDCYITGNGHGIIAGYGIIVGEDRVLYEYHHRDPITGETLLTYVESELWQGSKHHEERLYK